MMTTPFSTSATLAIVRKQVTPRIPGTGTLIEKRGKVTWDDIGCNNNHIVYYRPLTVTEWPTNGVIIYRYVSRLLLTFMSYCVLFCILYWNESTNKRYRNTVNNLISPNTVSQNDEKLYSKLPKYHMIKSPIPQYLIPPCPSPAGLKKVTDCIKKRFLLPFF